MHTQDPNQAERAYANQPSQPGGYDFAAKCDECKDTGSTEEVRTGRSLGRLGETSKDRLWS